MLLKNQIISVPLKINVRERIWFSNEPSNVHYPPWQIKSKSKLNKRRKSLGKKSMKSGIHPFFLETSRLFQICLMMDTFFALSAVRVKFYP